MSKKPKRLTHQQMVDKNVIRRKSTLDSPVKRCWQIFEDAKVQLGPKFCRKLAIDIALKKGIAYYTARTQWQEWRQAGDRDVATTKRLYGT